MASATSLRGPRRRWTARRNEAIAGILFASPWILGLLVLTAYPVGAAVYYSFTKFNILQPAQWIGAANYVKAFGKDDLFLLSLKNTLYYSGISVPLGLLFSVGLALLLNQPLVGRSFYRITFYMPSLVPAVANTIVWMLLLDPGGGLVNRLLGYVGIDGPRWLTNPDWIKPAFVLMGLWNIGPTIIIFLAGLQDIPQHLYEAAEIDGANAWQKAFHITLPLLSHVVFFNLIMGMIGSLQVFVQSFVAMGSSSGGPRNAGLFYVLYVYRNAFQYFNMGYACALSIILFALTLLLTLLVFRSSESWVYYAAEAR